MITRSFRGSFCFAAMVCLYAQASSSNERLPTSPPLHLVQVTDAAFDPQLVALGSQTYTRCGSCHGTDVVATGVAPDLRVATSSLAAVAFASIVRGGALQNRGMPGFPELTNRELDGLRYYIRSRAREGMQATRR